MKKMILTLMAVCAVMTAVAGSVYGRKNVTLNASGDGSTQLDFAYSGVKLQRVWLLNSAAVQSATLTRVDFSGVYTQAVCTVSSTNSTTAFTAAYLLPGDTILVAGSTNAVLQLEFEVQKH